MDLLYIGLSLSLFGGMAVLLTAVAQIAEKEGTR